MKHHERRIKSIGDEIRLARLLQYLSQSEVARQLRTTQPMISAFENGVVLPGKKMRKRLEEVLGIPPQHTKRVRSRD